MNTFEQPLVGTLDYYRKIAESNKDIANLIGVIDRQGRDLVRALEHIAQILVVPEVGKSQPDKEENA